MPVSTSSFYSNAVTKHPCIKIEHTTRLFGVAAAWNSDESRSTFPQHSVERKKKKTLKITIQFLHLLRSGSAGEKMHLLAKVASCRGTISSRLTGISAPRRSFQDFPGRNLTKATTWLDLSQMSKLNYCFGFRCLERKQPVHSRIWTECGGV